MPAWNDTPTLVTPAVTRRSLPEAAFSPIDPSSRTPFGLVGNGRLVATAAITSALVVPASSSAPAAPLPRAESRANFFVGMLTSSPLRNPGTNTFEPARSPAHCLTARRLTNSRETFLPHASPPVAAMSRLGPERATRILLAVASVISVYLRSAGRRSAGSCIHQEAYVYVTTRPRPDRGLRHPGGGCLCGTQRTSAGASSRSCVRGSARRQRHHGRGLHEPGADRHAQLGAAAGRAAMGHDRRASTSIRPTATSSHTSAAELARRAEPAAARSTARPTWSTRSSSSIGKPARCSRTSAKVRW